MMVGRVLYCGIVCCALGRLCPSNRSLLAIRSRSNGVAVANYFRE